MATSITLLDATLELADLLTPAWDEIRAGIPAWHPRNDDPDPTPDPDPAPEPDPDPAPEPDWKAASRKHESRSKAERKRADQLAAELEELKKGNQTEQEKALDQARKEAKAEALTEAQQERRADRLDAAVTRLAAKGVTVKDGDKDKLVKFADPEDALVFIERAIAKGDVDADDIFDSEGKVQTDALTTELAGLLERKPNLAASEGPGRPGGSSDAGRGGSGTDLDDMDVEAHLGAIKRHKT